MAEAKDPRQTTRHGLKEKRTKRRLPKASFLFIFINEWGA